MVTAIERTAAERTQHPGASAVVVYVWYTSTVAVAQDTAASKQQTQQHET